MPRTLTTAVESESTKPRLRAIDLLQVKLPAPIGTLYLSSVQCNYGGHTYLPRILSLGSWKRSLNAQTETLSVTLANTDGYITQIYNNVITMEFADVTLIRYYPDLNEAIDPLWIGYGGTITLDEEQATWNIHFGFRGMTQKGLRKLSFYCWKLFRDGLFCPYNPPTIGRCDTLASGCTDTDTTIKLNNYSWYWANDIILVNGEQMLITATPTSSTVSVQRGYNSIFSMTHSVGEEVYHRSCSKTNQACRRRGMHGPPEMPPVDNGGGRRYFGGWEQTSVAHSGAYPNPVVGGYFQVGVNWTGLVGSQGIIIPAVYGETALQSIPALWVYQSLISLEALFFISEGPATSIDVPTMSMNGNPVVTVKSGIYPNTINNAVEIWWGDIGQRKAYWYNTNTYLDSYAELPNDVNSVNGDGPSLSDVFAIWMRIPGIAPTETTNQLGVLVSLPNIDYVHMVGKTIKTVQGWINNDNTLTTSAPDPIEVAIDFCVNRKYGPRITIDKINLNVALTESQYCRELITSQDESEVIGTQHPRYMFNGAISDDKSAEEQLTLILQNCNGHYLQNNGLLEFGIRKAVDLTAVDALPVISDFGPARNILRNNGKSTLQVEESSDIDGYVNNIVVAFPDKRYQWQSNNIIVQDETMQTLAALIDNSDESRVITSKNLNLIGSSSEDQAIRLGALALRENYLQRVKVTFTMSLKESIKFAPGDIRKLVSNPVLGVNSKALAYTIPYIRIWEIEETDKFTAQITAYLHNNDMYDNTIIIPTLPSTPWYCCPSGAVYVGNGKFWFFTNDDNPSVNTTYVIQYNSINNTWSTIYTEV